MYDNRNKCLIIDRKISVTNQSNIMLGNKKNTWNSSNNKQYLRYALMLHYRSQIL